MKKHIAENEEEYRHYIGLYELLFEKNDYTINDIKEFLRIYESYLSKQNE